MQFSETEIRKINQKREQCERLDNYIFVIKEALKDRPIYPNDNKDIDAYYADINNALTLSLEHYNSIDKIKAIKSLRRVHPHLQADIEIEVIKRVTTKSIFHCPKPHSHNKKKPPIYNQLLRRNFLNDVSRRNVDYYIDRYLNNYQSYAKFYHGIIYQDILAIESELEKYNPDVHIGTLIQISTYIPLSNTKPIDFFTNNYQNNFKTIIMEYIESTVKSF